MQQIILTISSLSYLVLALNTNEITLNGSVLKGKLTARKKSFLGIPYAKPPTGELRFQPPQPPSALPAIVDASKYGNSCIQFSKDKSSAGTPESEDCLNLNVFVPLNHDVKSTVKLPVMVFIHGGSFRVGSSSNPSYSLDNIPADVIGVSINYRLGALGFLPLRKRANVNAGLLDQEMAFKWVRANIGQFGGDSTKITAVGQSAGAISIGAHLIARGGTQNLFDRAILLSGSPSIFPVRNFRVEFEAIAKAMGCPDGRKLKCLRKKPVEELVTGEGLIKFPFSPSIDGSYITQDSYQALQKLEFSKIPLLIHTNDDEGSIFGLVRNADEAKALRRLQFPMIADLGHAELDALYPFVGPQSGGELFGDVLFQCGPTSLAKAYAKAGVTVYKARNAHRNVINQWSAYVGPTINLGVSHMSELGHLFQNPALVDSSEAAWSASKQTQYFTFVRLGRIMRAWKPYGSDGNVFNIETETLETDNLKSAKCKVIDKYLKAAANSVTGQVYNKRNDKAYLPNLKRIGDIVTTLS